MSNPATRLSKIVGAQRPKGQRWHGIVGDFNGNVEVSGKPGYVYVRIPKGSGFELGEFPGKVTTSGMAVTIEHDPLTGQQVVVDSDPTAVAYSAGGSVTFDPQVFAIAPHADRHTLLGDDQVTIYSSQVAPLQITKSSADVRTLTIGAGAYTIRGSYYFKSAASSIDLDAYYPANGTKYVWVLISSAGVLSVQDDGATSYSAVLQPSIDHFAACLVALNAGYDFVLSDTVDARFIQTDKSASIADSKAVSAATLASAASSSASIADSKAGSAATLASTASSAASIADSKADVAITAASTASSAASLADSVADSAGTQASVASSAASLADSKSDSAATLANTASSAASLADSKSDSAATLATTASSAASIADSKAESATTLATTASSAASIADSKADSAVTIAAAASSAASNATASVAAASSKADSAGTQAATASSAASQATASIAAVDSKADSAATLANTASSEASNATASVAAASSKADSAATLATAADSKAESATTIANTASSAASVADSKAVSAAAVSPTGTGADTRLTYWTGNTTVGSDANLTWDATRLTAQIADAATNTLVYPIRVQHVTTDTAAANFGSGIEFYLEDASGNAQFAGSLGVRWTVATDGDEVSRFEGWTMYGGTEYLVMCVVGPGSASNNGNARGVGAIEFQSVRSGATQVASGVQSTIVGGSVQTASGTGATVVGGGTNVASGSSSTIVGGGFSTASGSSATVIGGYGCTAAGDYGIAAGRRAIMAAAHDGAFLFADGTDADFNSVAANEFALRARGGFRHAYDDAYYWTARITSAGLVTFDITHAAETPTFTFTHGVIVPSPITIGTKTLALSANLTLAGADGKTLTLTTDLTNNGAAGTITWGGAYALTVPATGTVAVGAGTCTVSTANNTATATHTHAITSSAAPGAAASLLATTATGLLTLQNLNTVDTVFIGDTANAKCALGLTINQGANDDEALALKSSDIAHGITDQAETDTFCRLAKYSATDGGVSILGLTETNLAIQFEGSVTTEDATRSTAAVGAVSIRGALKSGTGVGVMSADKNILVIRSKSTTRFIFDSDGDSFEDGTGWTAFDDKDDAALLDLANEAMVRDPIKGEFWSWVAENAPELERLNLIVFNRDGHHFINRSKMQELLVGAVRQLSGRLDRYELALRGLGTDSKQLN